jgi:hypothetical protein
MATASENPHNGATATPVDRRVHDLRRIADLDAVAAKDRAWAWFEELRDRAASDRGAADSELHELFRLGAPPRDLDGPTDGILVTTTMNPILDPAVHAVTRLWMPWQGKRFDAAANAGDNRLTGSARLPSKLLWPLYSMKDAIDGTLAFDFTTYVATSKDDADRQVMVIDYSGIEDNPRLVIRSVRDELVEIVPGAYLGKILFRLPSVPRLFGERYERIDYFALRTPA